MDTYWDNFIDEFVGYLADKPLRVILEAFWWYTRTNGREKCEKLMTEKQP